MKNVRLLEQMIETVPDYFHVKSILKLTEFVNLRQSLQWCL
jgi:hypothetical protein